MSENVTTTPYDLARIDIYTWRGRCLELFAKGEKAIGQTLETVRHSKAGANTKLRHLAGQRADDLAKHIGECAVTAKQKVAAQKALADWRVNEKRRNFLAHAVSVVTLDAKGDWFAVFDMTIYRADEPDRQRWTVGKAEAERFRTKLEESWKLLSGQLGQIRKKAGDA